MKAYTVYKRFSIEVSRTISAENMAEAEQKANSLKFDRFAKAAPGADMCDWDTLSGTSIHEERE